MISLLLSLCLQDLPTDKDAEEALKKLKAAVAEPAEDAQIRGIREALRTNHEKVIRAVANALVSGPERVRIGAALALGDTDNPASAEMLAAAISANAKTGAVLAALATALGRLEYEGSAAALHDLVKRVGETEVREAIGEILDALGRIGSVSSVDPLADLLIRVAGPRRNPWPERGRILQGTKDALRAITGHAVTTRDEFEEWWKANKAGLVAGARRTYWSKKTHERAEAGPGEKPPADSVFVHARLVEPPATAEKDRKRKKK